VKILHVVALIQASTGGPAVSVTRLASEQAKLGHEVTLACLDYPHLGPQVAAPGVRVVSVRGNLFAVRGRGWCPEFRRVLREEAAKADVVHNHGLWMWPNAYAREAAVAAGKPLIISPRGMLEAWSLGRSKLRKAVAWRLFERKNLQAAVMFHATAESERDSIRNIFSHGLTRIDTDSFSGGDCLGAISDQVVSGSARKSSSSKAAEVPIIVAPNGVDLPDLTRKPGREVLEERFPELKSRRWVMFMSRLHPKKGIDVLLRAWRQQQNVEQGAGCREQGVRGEKRQKEVMGGEWRVTSPDADESFSLLDSWSLSPVLVIAGSDLIGYRKDVERMVRDLGVEDSVVITGEVRGEMKDCLLGNAEVFVLPSYSENFGIVVAEAMAWERPVIASTGTPWKEVADVGAGWWIEPEEDALAKALAEALGKGQEELEAMGARGRALVSERYGWSVPANRLISSYKNILATDKEDKRLG
jgi:glycosyltransferase involved in cell wall biosynthesis